MLPAAPRLIKRQASEEEPTDADFDLDLDLQQPRLPTTIIARNSDGNVLKTS